MINTEIDQLKEELKNNPTSYDLLYRLGDALNREQRFEEAIEYYSNAFKINSIPNVELLNSLGKCYIKAGKIEEATKCFNETLTIDKTNVYSLRNLTKTYLLKSEYLKAKPLCKSLLNLGKMPDYLIEEYLVGQMKENNDIPFFEELYESYRTNIKFISIYVKCLKQNDLFNEAEKIILDNYDSLKSNPSIDSKQLTKLSNKMLSIYLDNEKYNQAESIIIERINNNPEDSSIIHFLVSLAVISDKYDLALAFIRSHLEKRKGNLHLLKYLFTIYFAMNDKKSQEDTLSKMVEIIKYKIEKKKAESYHAKIFLNCFQKLETYPIDEILFNEIILLSKENNKNFASNKDIISSQENINLLEKDDIIDKYYEGGKKSLTVNVYERNRFARTLCIKYHRPICYICKFDFGKTYGQEFQNKIHVHHIIPLSEIKEEYEVDPISDLIPVCPNCHFVIHSKRPALSPLEVITILNRKA